VTATAQANDNQTRGDAPLKDLYEIGEIPPLGHVPKNMYAWAIRRERHGAPEDAMKLEVVPTWELDSHEVLVLVMAAGVNYNGIWAGLGEPISPFDGHGAPSTLQVRMHPGSFGPSVDKVKTLESRR
jgi:crotonyl-CoA carboxylase/reductase